MAEGSDGRGRAPVRGCAVAPEAKGKNVLEGSPRSAESWSGASRARRIAFSAGPTGVSNREKENAVGAASQRPRPHARRRAVVSLCSGEKFAGSTKTQARALCASGGPTRTRNPEKAENGGKGWARAVRGAPSFAPGDAIRRRGVTGRGQQKG